MYGYATVRFIGINRIPGCLYAKLPPSDKTLIANKGHSDRMSNILPISHHYVLGEGGVFGSVDLFVCLVCKQQNTQIVING